MSEAQTFEEDLIKERSENEQLLLYLGGFDGPIDMLLSLARAQGRVKSRDQLLDEIRNRNYEVFDRSIDVHISALRRKLGDDPKEPRFIRTVRSAGYMLIRPDAA